MSDESFKHDKSYEKEFDDQLKEESQFMKTLSTEDQSTLQHKKQGDYISHEQQYDHFYKWDTICMLIMTRRTRMEQITNMAQRMMMIAIALNQQGP